LANYERGVYEPRDEARDGRVYDASEDDDDVEGSRLPLLIVLALLVLAMFGGVVWLAYTQGVARGRTETPVLAAAPGPERVAPQNTGGNTVPYQGFKIYEQPAPADDEADAPPTAPPEQAAPPPKAEKVVAPPPPKLAAAPPAPKPAPVAAKPPVAPPVMKQAATPPAAPQAAASSTAANGAPRTLPGVAAAAATTPAAKAAPGGSALLQIGAYKSQADADAAWRTYKARHAALLSGYGPDVQRADLGEKGTWYRLRVGGLGDREVALALCDRLKADGGACILSH